MGVTEIHSYRRYRLTNVKFGERAFHLSPIDNRSTTAHAMNGGDNEKWDFEKTDNGWHIMSVANGLYAAVEGPRNADNKYANGTRVIVTREPFTWNISPEEASQKTVFRISVPGTRQRLEFCYHGVLREGRVWDDHDQLQQKWEMSEIKRVIVIAGTGGEAVEGVAAARFFANMGYAIAIIDVQSDTMNQLRRELDYIPGYETVTFPVQSFSSEAIAGSWKAIKERFPSEGYEIRVGIWNTQQSILKKFLALTPEDLERSVQVNSFAAFEFARQTLLAFKAYTSVEAGNRKSGTLIFRGAINSLQGNSFTSAFSPAMFALRSLSQCLNKEFASENTHVAHVITDSLSSNGSGAKGREDEPPRRKAESLAKAYQYLMDQDKSTRTWELDLRSAQSSPKHALRMELLDLLSKVDDY